VLFEDLVEFLKYSGKKKFTSQLRLDSKSVLLDADKLLPHRGEEGNTVNPDLPWKVDPEEVKFFSEYIVPRVGIRDDTADGTMRSFAGKE
jgi:hypothetical protein